MQDFFDNKIVSVNDNYQLNWKIVSQPKDSNLKLEVKNDMRSIVEFTTKKEGIYFLKVIDIVSNEEYNTKFKVKDIVEYENRDIEGYKKGVDVEEIISNIKDQYWIYSQSKLDKNKSIVLANKYNLEVLGYDEEKGLLVKIIRNKENIINSLNKEKDVESIEQRIHRGRKLIKLNEYTLPDDGSKFNDGGDNWHLEDINMPEAWALYDGKRVKSNIGVIDGDFWFSHEKLSKNNFKKRFLSDKVYDDLKYNEVDKKKFINHGMAVSGVICGNTNNKKGISAINQNCKVHAVPFLIKIEDFDKSIRVVNNSYGSDYKDENKSIKHFKPYRMEIASNKQKNVLWVFAAGNESTDAVMSNGRIHQDLKTKKISKLSNLMVVAAYNKSGVLAHYSNYGKTVDIAAPAGFKAVKTFDRKNIDKDNLYFEEANESYYGKPESVKSFDGTSSSAAIVSAVASLIFEINPNFSPAQVKDILISTATDKIKQRYVPIVRLGIGFGYKKEDLKIKEFIPKLNAKAAIEKAIKLTKKEMPLKGIFVDNKTGLIWQDNEEVKIVVKSWNEAFTYCKNLTLGENKDWRLPNKVELLTIVDKTKTPKIIDGFKNVVGYHHWVSNEHNHSEAWNVDFNSGEANIRLMKYKFNIRCVRAGQ